MKKRMAALLTLVFLLTASLSVFADYRGPVDGMEMSPGFNPVIQLSDDGTFTYTVYARDMEGMKNADLSVQYDSAVLEFLALEETGNYNMIGYSDHSGEFYLSFVYQEANSLNTVPLFVLTFRASEPDVYPSLTVTNLAGTFIRSVASPVILAAQTEKPVAQKLGDVDLDGEVTAADARLALRVSVMLETISEIQTAAADVNADGYVTAEDARSILRAAIGLQKLDGLSVSE